MTTADVPEPSWIEVMCAVFLGRPSEIHKAARLLGFKDGNELLIYVKRKAAEQELDA